jgi:hypothetical protein
LWNDFLHRERVQQWFGDQLKGGIDSLPNLRGESLLPMNPAVESRAGPTIGPAFSLCLFSGVDAITLSHDRHNLPHFDGRLVLRQSS